MHGARQLALLGLTSLRVLLLIVGIVEHVLDVCGGGRVDGAGVHAPGRHAQ